MKNNWSHGRYPAFAKKNIKSLFSQGRFRLISLLGTRRAVMARLVRLWNRNSAGTGSNPGRACYKFVTKAGKNDHFLWFILTFCIFLQW